MLTASAIKRTSGCGRPARNSASSLFITCVVPERKIVTLTSGATAWNAATVCAAIRSGCEV
jgi:hypothetical protein